MPWTKTAVIRTPSIKGNREDFGCLILSRLTGSCPASSFYLFDMIMYESNSLHTLPRHTFVIFKLELQLSVNQVMHDERVVTFIWLIFIDSIARNERKVQVVLDEFTT
jgi:hypothetical protein